MSTIKERVQAGAELLDREEPGWEQRIDVRELDLQDACRCILGQLYGDYDDGIALIHLPDEDSLGFDFGFNSTMTPQFRTLTRAWKALIRERRAAPQEAQP